MAPVFDSDIAGASLANPIEPLSQVVIEVRQADIGLVELSQNSDINIRPDVSEIVRVGGLQTDVRVPVADDLFLDVLRDAGEVFSRLLKDVGSVVPCLLIDLPDFVHHG